MAENDVVRIKTGVQMSSVMGSTQEDTIEFSRAEWDAMDAEQREAMLEQIAQETLNNHVEAWAYVDEEG